MDLYKIKEVGGAFIIITDNKRALKITFADGDDRYDYPAPKKEDATGFFRGTTNKWIGLETPGALFNAKRNILIFTDIFVDVSGTRKALPSTFSVASIQVS